MWKCFGPGAMGHDKKKGHRSWMHNSPLAAIRLSVLWDSPVLESYINNTRPHAANICTKHHPIIHSQHPSPGSNTSLTPSTDSKTQTSTLMQMATMYSSSIQANTHRTSAGEEPEATRERYHLPSLLGIRQPQKSLTTTVPNKCESVSLNSVVLVK